MFDDHREFSLPSVLFLGGLYVLGMFAGRRQVMKEIEQIAQEEEINKIKKEIEDLKRKDSNPYSSYFYS